MRLQELRDNKARIIEQLMIGAKSGQELQQELLLDKGPLLHLLRMLMMESAVGKDGDFYFTTPEGAKRYGKIT